MPEFSGGHLALRNFLAKHLKYPPMAKVHNISGKVYITFVVNKSGYLKEVEVLRGAHPLLDNEALRVVKSMPKWKPGKHNDRPIAVSFNLPINFDLNNRSGSKNNANSSESLFSPSDLTLKAEINYNKGYKLLKKEKYENAIDYFSEAIKSYPSYRNALYNRAFAYKKLGLMENACSDWNKCIELGVKEAEPYAEKHCNLKHVSDTLEAASQKFNIVETIPEYPGGQTKMMQYIQKKVQYPREAIDSNISGKVYINFIVNKDGSITDAKVLRGVHPLLDEEALRVVKSMPKWKPGTQKGLPVKVSFNLPINFNLK